MTALVWGTNATKAFFLMSAETAEAVNKKVEKAKRIAKRTLRLPA
ncbi:MAG TPA: hypothetical protein VMP03_06380 [Methylomirabilota bacterium]|nr:hypothetical protein [Methylomirabilota bacterium]